VLDVGVLFSLLMRTSSKNAARVAKELITSQVSLRSNVDTFTQENSMYSNIFLIVGLVIELKTVDYFLY
jgi:hypothetical protein